MPEHGAEHVYRDSSPRWTGPAMPVGLFAALVVAILTLAGIGARYWTRGISTSFMPC